MPKKKTKKKRNPDALAQYISSRVYVWRSTRRKIAYITETTGYDQVQIIEWCVNDMFDKLIEVEGDEEKECYFDERRITPDEEKL